MVGDGGGTDGFMPPTGDGGLRCTEDSQCDDGVDCTQDSCNAETRRCRNTVAANACDDGNSCTTDVCDVEGSGCTNEVLADGTACTDTGGVAGMCSAGACASGCTTDAECADAFPCTVNTCDAATGMCQAPTLDDSVCDDANSCTVDMCTSSGCANSLAADGIACTSAGGVDGTCAAGSCVTGCTSSAECDDGVACTTDTCDTAVGACSNTPEDTACDDGVACTVDSCSAATGCTATPMNSACNDGVACTNDVCDAAAGCMAVPNDLACDDSVGCTVDVCGAAADCSNTPDDAMCNDSNPCTTNVCDATGDCGSTNVGAGAPCTDTSGRNGQCDGAGACEVGCATDADCLDGDACDGAESCDTTNGTCVAGVPLDCDDGNTCTDDACDTTAGCSNVSNDANCDDGNPCTVGTCTGSGCAQSNVSDTTACTLGGNSGQCQSGTCVIGCTTDGDCDDGVACTTDSCDLGTGSCVNAPSNAACDDAVACTTDTCTATGCQNSPVSAACNDSNSCTTEMCTATGCNVANVANGTPCTDGGGDAGLCMSGACSVECTSAADCADGNACDGMETCSANGQCQEGTPLVCNDSNACTTDSCNMASGCVNAPVTCDDSTPCTADTCNMSTGCAYTPMPSSCDDGNECTSEVCTSGGGCSNPSVVDGTSCMSGAGTCQAGTCLTTNPTTFRLNSLALQDPHVIVDYSVLFISICADIANDSYSGFIDIPALNATLAESVTMDSDGDGSYDLGIAVHFPDLDRTAGATGTGRVVESDCSFPDPSTCTPIAGSATDVSAGYTIRRTGSCTPTPVTTYYDGRSWPDGRVSTPNQPTAGGAGCFITDPTSATLAFEVSGTAIQIPLEDAQIGAQFDAAETTLSNGVLVGFLSEAVADTINITVSGQTLNLGRDLLPEPDHCDADSPDARDMSGATRGWWFTLNLTGTAATGTGF